MALHGDRQLGPQNVVRVDEVGADEEQHQIGHLQLLIDLAVPVFTRADLPVVPRRQQPAALENFQVAVELVAQRLVFVRVAVEQADRDGAAGLSTHGLNSLTSASQPLRSTTTSLPTATNAKPMS